MNKQQGFSKLYDTIINYGYDENEKLQIGKNITKKSVDICDGVAQRCGSLELIYKRKVLFKKNTFSIIILCSL